MAELTDIYLIKKVLQYIGKKEKIKIYNQTSHPFDNEVKQTLEKILLNIEDDESGFKMYDHIDQIKEIWIQLIDKSIQCLRYYDPNEPFNDEKAQKPFVYGIDELKNYFENYIQFEHMLYGSNKNYRDHVIHSFRVWLLGNHCLILHGDSFFKKLNIMSDIKIGNIKNLKPNDIEYISIWTIIALTHDLGYPLEKAHGIIEKTLDMMQHLVSRPTVDVDLSFDGTQTNMNDFILKLISSKMVQKSKSSDDSKNSDFVVRIQPKFYFKFQKSLERRAHGIVSVIIIYKLLMFFIESEFNINEDYYFSRDEIRQFYIKREILRSIAAHTCRDIYHMNLFSFPFLLILCDDYQEWGRRQLSQLFFQSKSKYSLMSMDLKNNENDINECTISDTFEIIEKVVKDEDIFSRLETIQKNVKAITSGLYNNFLKYKQLLRDGPDTLTRDFNLSRQTTITAKIEQGPKKGNKTSVLFELHVACSMGFIVKSGSNMHFVISLPSEAFTDNEQNDQDETKLCDNCERIVNDHKKSTQQLKNVCSAMNEEKCNPKMTEYGRGLLFESILDSNLGITFEIEPIKPTSWDNAPLLKS